jgi:hypothetical protein
MKKYFVTIVLALTSASFVLGVPGGEEWIKYTSPEGRYSVSLPAQPTLKTQVATAATGDKFSQYLAIVIEPGDVVFLTGYYDLVPGVIFSADAVRAAMVKQIGGTLISETPINLGNYPGRELKVLVTTSKEPVGDGKPAAKVEYLLRVRFYEVDKRIYVLQVIFPKPLESETLAAKATKYFDSFHVVKD